MNRFLGLLRRFFVRLRVKRNDRSGFEDFVRLTEIHKSDKWSSHDYAFPYYLAFNALKYQPVRLLEIGIGGYDEVTGGYGDPMRGGESLRFWKGYFPHGKIYGLDIEDKTGLQEDRIQIFQGSQIDASVLERVISEIGDLDIIIDDGSHINSHVLFTFAMLFPKLKNGGLYVVEDCQSSYWQDGYGGKWPDRNSPDTIVGYFKSLVDGLNHAEFPLEVYEPDYFERNILGISFFHNLIFIRKGQNLKASNVIRRHC